MTEKANILVVDDRASNRQALEVLLEPLEENVVCLESGEAALRFLLKGHAAVVLLDVDMPGMDGFETAKMIRSRERTKHVPLVFVTALDADGTRARQGYDLGAVDYLVKPVVPDILRAKVGVFVQLFHDHRERLRSLADELEAERAMAAAWQGREQKSERFNGLWEAGLQLALETEYRVVLKARVDHEVVDDRVRNRAKTLAERIGRAGGGPRELLTVHRKVSKAIITNMPPRQGRALRDQCRLLTLELMGHLVEHYRHQVPRRPDQDPEGRHGRALDRRSR